MEESGELDGDGLTNLSLTEADLINLQQVGETPFTSCRRLKLNAITAQLSQLYATGRRLKLNAITVQLSQ